MQVWLVDMLGWDSRETYAICISREVAERVRDEQIAEWNKFGGVGDDWSYEIYPVDVLE